MFITVEGSGSKKREMAADAAHWYAMHLMPRLQNKLFVNIKLIHKLEKKEGLSGDAIWEDDSCNRPREFTIRVDSSMSPANMLMTIAHEMVHVKQYARGELKDFSRNIKICKWKGEVLECEKINYYDLPYEIEAHGREKGLFIRWFNQSQWKKCKWGDV